MKQDKYLLSSVNNTLELIDLLSRHESLTLADICKQTGFDKASAFRMLYTLQANDLVDKSDDAHYRLGLKFIRYGNQVVFHQNIVAVALPHMECAMHDLGAPLHLGVLSGNRVVTLHILEPSYDIQVTGRIGMSAPAYSTAMGRVLLAWQSPAALNDLLASFTYRTYNETSPTNDAEVRALLEDVLKNKYATDIDERYRGYGGVAVPIFGFDNKISASLSLITLAQDVRERLDETVPVLTETANAISKALGAQLQEDDE